MRGRAGTTVGDAVHAPAPEVLRALEGVCGALLESDWTALPDGDLEAVAAVHERLLRRMKSVGNALASEFARRHERRGRSTGSAATRVAATLGVSHGEAARRIDAGSRADSAAGSALAHGTITAGQERTIATWLGELPDDASPGVREGIQAELLAAARTGLGVRSSGTLATHLLAAADSLWLERREERQAKRRGGPRLTGRCRRVQHRVHHL